MWPVFTVLGNRFPLKAMWEGARKKLNVSKKYNINIHIWHVSSITLSTHKMWHFATGINSNLQLWYLVIHEQQHADHLVTDVSSHHQKEREGPVFCGVAWFKYIFSTLFNISYHLSIDATYSKQLGKFVNDDRMTNCKMFHMPAGRNHHLYLFTTKDIPAYHQLLYDYGDSFYRWRVCLTFLIILVLQCYLIRIWSTYTLIERLH